MSGQSARNVGRRKRFDPGNVLLDDAAGRRPMDLAEVFDNARPVEVEVGTGKGTFLLARAQARPEVNLLGIESAKPYCYYAADRVRRWGLANARMLHGDAAAVFRRALPDAGVLRVHVYFPDPWPKRRHHTRRLIQPAFVADVRRVLRPGGELLVMTDHMEYFAHIRRVLADVPGLARTPFPKLSDVEGETVGTNFERKYIAQGLRFYRLASLRYV
jgi:tRNA (guanine-N7-)-methyltransferase